MKVQILISSLVTASLLTGCGQQFEVASPSQGALTPSYTLTQTENKQPETTSSKLMSDVSNGLREKASASGTGIVLSDAEIQDFVKAALDAVASKGLGGSSDFKTLLPVIIEAISQQMGQMNLSGNSTVVADLMARVGTLVIDSLKKHTGGGLQGELLETLARSLFQNITQVGVNPVDVSKISGDLMNLLVSHLSQQPGLQSGPLASLLQNLAAGATSGVGKLNLGDLKQVLLKEIVKQIGLGSTQGLSGTHGDIVQTLIDAITKGSKSGLGQVIGSNPQIGVTLNQLLSNLISGQSQGLPSLPIGGLKQQIIAAFLQLLISKL